jgi:predicted RNase H-like HicB family nuclease
MQRKKRRSFDVINRKLEVKKMINIPIQIITEKSGKHYVAFCIDLDVVSQGKTEEEAKKNLRNAVTQHLSAAHELGIEKEVLGPIIARSTKPKLSEIEVPRPCSCELPIPC